MRLLFAVLAYSEFLVLDVVGFGGFSRVHTVVKRTATAKRAPSPQAVDNVVRAVRDAATLYFKSVRCLQRSAAVTRMLRRRGVAAEMVIGYEAIPLHAHAWVVVDGEVVSDATDGLEHYHVIDRW